LLVTPKLKDLPSMNVSSLSAFLRYKKMARGTVLTATDDSQPLTYRLTGNTIECTGRWKANKKMKQFGAAVSRLHRAHGLTGDYDDVCERCTAIDSEGSNAGGCRYHRARPKLIRRGNPTRSEDFVNIRDALVDGSYTEQGCDALNPKDIRHIRSYLLAQNSIYFMGVYTAILVAVCLFLRSDEMLPLSVADFFPSCFVRTPDGKIRALCLRIWGKKEKGWRYYWLWVDDEYPDLCPVRHLLIFVHLSGIQEGFLFPTEKELALNIAGNVGRYDTHISYSTFSKFFCRMCSRVLTNGGNVLNLGLHVFRKTAYKFAIWGYGQWEVIKNDARHKNDEDARNYAGDSESSMQLAHIFNDPMNKVKRYRATFCKSPKISALDTINSTANGVELSRLAAEYVGGLKLPKNVSTDMKTLLDASLKTESTTTATELFEKLGGLLGGEAKELLAEALKQMNAEQNAMARHEAEAFANQSSSLKRSSTVLQESGENDELPPYAAKRSKSADQCGSGGADIPGREVFSKLPTLESKLEWLLSTPIPEPATLAPKAAVFVHRTANPMLRCLQHHHGGDAALFCSHWTSNGRNFVVKFANSCCKGSVGGSCGLE